MLSDSGRPAIVKFCVLSSGSSGNCALLATERTRILVDAGLSFKALVKRLETAGEHAESLNAMLVTHEHSDHISGLARMSRRLGIPVYISRLTAPAIDWGETPPRLEPFQAGAQFHIGDIEVESFGIPHDAVDPVGFCFTPARRPDRGGHRPRLHSRIGQVSPAAHATCCCSNPTTISRC